jgi:hypothetical protein
MKSANPAFYRKFPWLCRPPMVMKTAESEPEA